MQETKGLGVYNVAIIGAGTRAAGRSTTRQQIAQLVPQDRKRRILASISAIHGRRPKRVKLQKLFDLLERDVQGRSEPDTKTFAQSNSRHLTNRRHPDGRFRRR